MPPLLTPSDSTRAPALAALPDWTPAALTLFILLVLLILAGRPSVLR